MGKLGKKVTASPVLKKIIHSPDIYLFTIKTPRPHIYSIILNTATKSYNGQCPFHKGGPGDAGEIFQRERFFHVADFDFFKKGVFEIANPDVLNISYIGKIDSNFKIKGIIDISICRNGQFAKNYVAAVQIRKSVLEFIIGINITTID